MSMKFHDYCNYSCVLDEMLCFFGNKAVLMCSHNTNICYRLLYFSV